MAVKLKKIVAGENTPPAEVKVAPVAVNDDTVEALSGALQKMTVDEGLEKEIEALGQLQDELALVDPVRVAKMKDYEKRCKALKDRLITLGLAQKVSETYYAEVGEPGQKRQIKDKNALVKALGAEKFIELASIALADIDKYLDEAQKAEVLLVTNDGARSFAIKKRV